MAEATTREQLRAILRTKTGSMAALAEGLKLAVRTAPVGLTTAIVYGALSGFLGSLIVEWTKSADQIEHATLELVAQVLMFGGAFATIYAIVQFNKRDRVSRQSWWPALFAIPLLLIGGAIQLLASGQQYGPAVPAMVWLGWTILYASFAGAAAAIAWLRAGASKLDGRPVGAGAILGEVGGRLFDVAGAHGARVHAVTIGMQVLLPGIFYALQYAFTDAIAVLDPEKPALARSGQLAYGMKGRLFRLLLVWWLLGVVLSIAIAVGMQHATSVDALIELVVSMVVDPTSPPPSTFAAQQLVWALLTWVLSLAMLVLYREREAQVRAKTELKKLDAAAASAKVSEPEAG